MVRNLKKNGFTLVEILITVAIIVVLASIVVALVGRFDSQAKQKKLEAAFYIINSALEDFKESNFKYYDNTAAPRFYPNYNYPLDFNDTATGTARTELIIALGLTNTNDDLIIVPPNIDPEFSGCAVMYFLLSRVPGNKAILEKIDKSLITNLDTQNNFMSITITRNGVSQDEPFYRIVDPWGTTLRYDYYDEIIPATNPNRYKTRRNFPLLTSAGPDKLFGTVDDIKSIK